MKPWHSLSIDELAKALEERAKFYGPNQLEESEIVPWYSMLARQFFNILILVLLLATFLSFFLGDLVDAFAILTIVLFNGFLGFIQEWKAETAIKNLKKMISPTCRVLRNGEEQILDVKKLIPGDCVILNNGNIVPADIRLTETVSLMVNEAMLTGESAPVSKIIDTLPENTAVSDRRNIVFMGTHVVNGHGRGIVVETGMETEFGHIAKLTGAIQETQTQLQKQLSILGRQFGILALLISAIVVIIGVISGKNTIQMLMTGVSLAVSAIPEGLPAVVTIALALGVRAMAQKKALLRHLQAAETLGAVSVICTDKTGTLTKNEMNVQKIWISSGAIDVTGTGYEPKGSFQKNNQNIELEAYPELIDLLETGQKCNHSYIKKDGEEWKAIGSPDEAALIVAAKKLGLDHHQYKITNEFTFDSNRKCMSVVEQIEQHSIVHVKGAPEIILAKCTHFLIGNKEKELSQEYLQQIKNAYLQFAKEGFRTLALARKIMVKSDVISLKDAESHLTFLGIVGLFDQPRPEVYGALLKTKAANIKVIVITGDSPITAQAIAQQLGLNIEITATSNDIKEMSDEGLHSLLNKNVLFARTVPEDKFRIVKLLQDQGDLVAMTGDGVNDAPALKQADIGIAMGIRGSDVARSVADIVLSDDNFSSIVAAVEEGRRQYANIRKFVLYLVSSNIGEVLAILINIIVGGSLILIPIQILWINLVTDSATAISLSVEKAEKDIMQRPPRQANQRILEWKSLLLLGLFGSYIGIATFLIYHFYLNESYEVANTMAFTAIVIMANVHTLNFRTLHRPIAEIGWFSNKWLLMAVIVMLGLQVIVLYVPGLQVVFHTVPLTSFDWSIIALAALPLFLVPEIYKWYQCKL